MALYRLGVGVGIALVAAMSVVACGDDDPEGAGPAAESDGADPETGARDTGSDEDDAAQDSGRKDSGPKDSGDAGDAGDAADVKVPPLPPGTIIDLAGIAESHVSAKLTWTSPPGTTSAYEVRYAATAITTDAEFLAATAFAAPPAPLPPGTLQTVIADGLAMETTYHFVVRAKDGTGVFGPISNDVMVTTKARATFLITEVAPANSAAEGGDFVELVATKAGSAANLELRAALDGPPLHTFATLDVVVGDRVVVHVGGLPGPAGFAQEDATKDKLSSTAANASVGAFDVYSAVADLPGHAPVVLKDGDAFMDIVPYSNHVDVEGDVALGAIFGAAQAVEGGAWTFSKPLGEFESRCEILTEIVNASGNESAECGAYPGFVQAGASIQRNGLSHTKTPADFFVAAQTPGATNAQYCAPESARVALSEINPRAGLVELKVVQGGRVRGFTLRTNPFEAVGPAGGTEVISLPDFCPSAGDLVVVHLGSNATPNETAAKNQHLRATYPAYYDGAWDVVTANTIPFAATLVLGLRNPGNVFVDVAAFSDQVGTPVGEYVSSLRWVQGLGLWMPANCGGQLCGNSTVPTARGVAADWSLLDATPATSIKRSTAAGAPAAASWSVGPATFGQ